MTNLLAAQTVRVVDRKSRRKTGASHHENRRRKTSLGSKGSLDLVGQDLLPFSVAAMDAEG
jgi:hypothetical protein